jgi:hypothetical protein
VNDEKREMTVDDLPAPSLTGSVEAPTTSLVGTVSNEE